MTATLLCIAPHSMAETIVVTNLADAGQGSLRSAIVSANGSSEDSLILFKKNLSGIIRLTTGPMEVTGSLVIDGPGTSRLTLSGNNASRAFNLGLGTNLVLKDVTIADARSDEQEDLGPITVTRGGAIFNDGGYLRLSNVVMRDNITIDTQGSDVVGGGAIVNSGFATLVVTDCVFINNVASGGRRYAFGGAIGNVTDSIATIENCTFLGNEANSGSVSYGGAIGNFGMSSIAVNQSVFEDNRASGVEFGEKGFGGAIATRPGTVENSGSLTEVNNSQFRFNLARSSAGDSDAGVADAGGGALYNERSDLFIQRCNLLKNEAVGSSGGDAFGGAIHSTGVFDAEPLTEIRRCHFSGNIALSRPGEYGTSGTSGMAAGGALNNALGTMFLSQTTINHNFSLGGAAGTGIGGGLYNHNLATVTADGNTIRRIVGNVASTSNDDVFGTIDVQ